MAPAADDPRTVLVAAFQVADVQDDPQRAVDVIRACSERAAGAGARIAVFPECFIHGYTRDEPEAIARAVALDSPAFGAILSATGSCGTGLVFGLIERRGEALFNTAVVVANEQLIGVYRKRHPIERCFTAGHELPVFDLNGLRFGIGLCSDARHRDDARQLARQGVDAILFPLNNQLPNEVAAQWRDRHAQILSLRARETGAWVISSDVVGSRRDHISYGCTAAFDADGSSRGWVPETTSGMLLAAVPTRTGGDLPCLTWEEG